jgi:Apea-like HEPN
MPRSLDGFSVSHSTSARRNGRISASCGERCTVGRMPSPCRLPYGVGRLQPTGWKRRDKLIDYWIGLEALFIPDAKQELRLRASLRGAAFLGQQPEERGRIFETLRDSYDGRSAIVHGSTPDRKVQRRSTLTAVITTTGAHLRGARLAFLRADRPVDPEEFERQLFAPSLFQDPSASPPTQDT